MNHSEINQLYSLKAKGWGYKKIAAELGLPLNSVKSYIRRHPEPENVSSGICDNCGMAFSAVSNSHKKRFCSDTCRNAWWRVHQHEINHTKEYEHLCRYCGTHFKNCRKTASFCSRKCFADYRRKAVKE